jgi:DNA gyrase/topoisomerase IV subunit B
VPGALFVGKFRSTDAYFALLDVSRGEPRREFIQDNALSVANLDI